MVSGYEDGYDDLEPGCIKEADVRLNVNKRWYAGRHDEAYAGNQDKGSDSARVLILQRPFHEDGE